MNMSVTEKATPVSAMTSRIFSRRSCSQASRAAEIMRAASGAG